MVSLSARASGPMPSAIARATAAVFPHRDSYTTIAFMVPTFLSITLTKPFSGWREPARSLPDVLGPEGGVTLDELTHELDAALVLDDLDLNAVT